MRIELSPPRGLAAAAAALAIATTACTDDGPADTDTGTETETAGDVDEAAVIAEAMGYQGWVLINATPFMSAGHDGGMAIVNVWVPQDLAAQYKSIDPADPMATNFAEGSIIVKEHLDDMGMPAAGTIMYKGPAGYSADSGDWWWGMGDVLGGNLTASGPDLAGCIGCHMTQTTTDWVFGVSPAKQKP